MDSICHFRGEKQLSSSQQIKWLHSMFTCCPHNWNYGVGEKSLGFLFIFFYTFQTLAGILEETEPGPRFSQLEHDHLSQLSKELEHDFPTTEDPCHGKEWICDTFVSKAGESMSEKRRSTAWNPKWQWQPQISMCSGLKSRWNMLRLQQKLLFPTSCPCEAGFSAVTATKTRF